MMRNASLATWITIAIRKKKQKRVGERGLKRANPKPSTILSLIVGFVPKNSFSGTFLSLPDR
jgi:hypothetical protein